MPDNQMTATPSLILVVDDDEDFQDSLAGFLETKGHTVHTVDSGIEALAYCDQHTPNIILLDADMPVRNGFSVCLELHNSPKTDAIPVIMITAMSDRASVDKAFDAGAEEYITKPVNWSVLNLRIHRIIERRKLEAQQRIYARVFEQSPASIVLTDLDGIIQHVNPFFSK